MIPPRVAAEIRRLYAVEGWRRNTIARHLGVHHSTVTRALRRSGLLASGQAEPGQRPSKLDPFVAWIKQTLKRYPELPASVVYEMLCERGYRGGPDHVRHRIAELGLRPQKASEAFFELRTLPGEQAQVDWASFGTRQVEGGSRRLLAFVMVLSYSRWLFVRFAYDGRLASFLAGHVEAFTAFGGVPRLALYDNLKSAVAERVSRAVRFHPQFLALADHYGFDPRPVAPRRGNEKGRVERAIRYLRTSFFPLRSQLDLEALNREARRWCRERASQRPWPDDRRRTVEQAFARERSQLLPLPAEPFPAHELVAVQVAKTPVVRFDANRYTVPHDRIRRTLTIAADLERVRIFDRNELIATHPRAWSKGRVIEDPDHLEALRKAKRQARLHRGQHRLLAAVPRAERLLAELARRQRRLAGAVDHLLALLDEHGPRELDAAIAESLEAGSPHPATVRLILDRRRLARGAPPPLALRLPDDPRVRDLIVTPHPLTDYDPDDDEEESPP